MSQRLIQPGLSALAGTVIGYRKDGRPIHLAAGGAPEEGEGSNDDSGGGDDDSGSDDEDDEEGDDGKGKKPKDDDEEEEEVVSKRKYDQVTERMKAADRRAAAAEAKIEELKDSAKIPDEVKRELNEIKASMAEKDKVIKNLETSRNTATIKLAALTLKGAPEWENVEAALRLTDLEDVDVYDDGKVDTRALKTALKKTALEHPYLVKKKTEDKGTTESGASGTGSTMNGRRGKPQAPDRATLASRFPVLNQATPTQR